MISKINTSLLNFLILGVGLLSFQVSCIGNTSEKSIKEQLIDKFPQIDTTEIVTEEFMVGSSQVNLAYHEYGSEKNQLFVFENDRLVNEISFSEKESGVFQGFDFKDFTGNKTDELLIYFQEGGGVAYQADYLLIITSPLLADKTEKVFDLLTYEYAGSYDENLKKSGDAEPVNLMVDFIKEKERFILIAEGKQHNEGKVRLMYQWSDKLQKFVSVE